MIISSKTQSFTLTVWVLVTNRVTHSAILETKKKKLTGLFTNKKNSSPPLILFSNFSLPPGYISIYMVCVYRPQVCLGNTLNDKILNNITQIARPNMAGH